MPFTISDPDTPLSSLVLTGASSDQFLVPNSGITFSGTGSNRTATISSPGGFGYTTITIRVTDPTGATAAESFDLGLFLSNGPPTISSISNISIAENSTSGIINFTVNDAKTPANQLSVTATSSNTSLLPNSNILLGGTDSNRTIRVTPLAGQTGSTVITVRVTDTDSATATESFVVSVFDVANRPTISPISDVTINEDTSTNPIPFTLSDSDTPASFLSLTVGSSNVGVVPISGILLAGTGANRTIQINPAANASGVATISLTVSDGTGSYTETFDVNVVPVNDKPTISFIPDTTIPENASMPPTPFTVNDVETNPNNLTISATSNNPFMVPPDHIIVGGTGTNRTVAVNPVADRQGTATITLTVNDGNGGMSSSSFMLTVSGNDDPPTISIIPDQTLMSGTTTNVPFTVGDDIKPSSELFIGAYSSDQSIIDDRDLHILGTGDSRSVSVTPLQAGGPVTISVIVSDGINNTTTTFNVISTSNGPSISLIPDQVINEDTSTGPLAFTLSDPDTSVASMVVTASSSDQSIVPNSNIVLGGGGANRTVNVTPLANANGGPVVITLSTSDGTNTATRTFNLSVTPVNDAPVISSIADQVVGEGTSTGPISFTVTDVDSRIDLLTVTGSSNNQVLVPNGGIVITGTGASRTVDVTPAPNATGGPAVITLTVSDGFKTSTESFNVTISAINDAPTISVIADQVINEDSSTGAIGFILTDPDTPLDTLTVTAVSSNQTLVPNANIVLGGTGGSRTVTVTPAANISGGPSVITISVFDGLNTVTESFNVTVNPVNDAPTISAIADQTINEDTSTGPLAFTLSDSDTPVGSLTVTASSNNQSVIPNSNIVIAGTGTNRTVTITPAANASGGPVIIMLTVSDGTSATTAAFNVTVTSVNDAPTISAIADQVINENSSTGALAFTIGDAETAATSLTVTATSNNQTLVPNANVVIGGTGTNRTVTVTPAANANGGPAIITVTVSDGTNSASETFNVTVTPVGVDIPGDSNRDGVFDSSDLIFVFAAGEYEDGIAGNSTWEEGDWNGDGDFDSSDLIVAFAAGYYESSTPASSADTISQSTDTSSSDSPLSGNLVDAAIAADDIDSRDDLLYRWVKRALS